MPAVNSSGTGYELVDAPERMPPGGTAGQVLSKTEDGTAWTDPPSGGVQPDWNQNDPTAADYIKNRTHYDEQTVIEWDGDTTGKISVSNAFFRVSELTPTAANLLGGRLLWEREGFETTDCIIDTEMAAQSGDVVIIGGGELGIVALSAGATIGNFAFAEPGVYVTECDYFEMSYGVTHNLPRKYLPPDAILPPVTTSDDGKLLQVVNGEWAAVDIGSAVELLAETGVAEPVTDGSAILTDANGIIYVL